MLLLILISNLSKFWEPDSAQHRNQPKRDQSYLRVRGVQKMMQKIIDFRIKGYYFIDGQLISQSSLDFKVEDIGKHIKFTKRRFTWVFSLHSRVHELVAEHSYISGKVKVAINRQFVVEKEMMANCSFEHPFIFDGFVLNVVELQGQLELRINNKVFSHLHHQAKTKLQFTFEEQAVRDIPVSKELLENSRKKIRLKLKGNNTENQSVTKIRGKGQEDQVGWKDNDQLKSTGSNCPPKNAQKQWNELKKVSSHANLFLLSPSQLSGQSKKSVQEKKTAITSDDFQEFERQRQNSEKGWELGLSMKHVLSCTSLKNPFEQVGSLKQSEMGTGIGSWSSQGSRKTRFLERGAQE